MGISEGLASLRGPRRIDQLLSFGFGRRRSDRRRCSRGFALPRSHHPPTQSASNRLPRQCGSAHSPCMRLRRREPAPTYRRGRAAVARGLVPSAPAIVAELAPAFAGRAVCDGAQDALRDRSTNRADAAKVAATQAPVQSTDGSVSGVDGHAGLAMGMVGHDGMVGARMVPGVPKDPLRSAAGIREPMVCRAHGSQGRAGAEPGARARPSLAYRAPVPGLHAGREPGGGVGMAAGAPQRRQPGLSTLRTEVLRGLPSRPGSAGCSDPCAGRPTFWRSPCRPLELQAGTDKSTRSLQRARTMWAAGWDTTVCKSCQRSS